MSERTYASKITGEKFANIIDAVDFVCTGRSCGDCPFNSWGHGCGDSALFIRYLSKAEEILASVFSIVPDDGLCDEEIGLEEFLSVLGGVPHG